MVYNSPTSAIASEACDEILASSEAISPVLRLRTVGEQGGGVGLAAHDGVGALVRVVTG